MNKGVLFGFVVVAALSCGKTQPNSPTTAITATPNNASMPLAAAKIEDIFLDLPAEVWTRLPPELQFLSQRDMREKILKKEDFKGCEGEKNCGCNVMEDGTTIYISELPLPKGVAASEEKDGGEMGTVYTSCTNSFYLSAHQRKDGKYVVLLSCQLATNGDTDYTSQLSDAKVWMAHSRLYDPQNRQWSDYRIADGKTLSQLLPESSTCYWAPDFLGFDEQGNKYPPSWKCVCTGAPESARVLSWTGDGYEMLMRPIPSDTYSGN